MQFSKKFTAALLAAITTVGLLTGCGKDSASGKENGKPIHLKVGYSNGVCQAGLFAAKEQGFFKEEGLDVEMVQIDPAHASDAIAAGQVDVLQGLASKMIQPISNGLPVKVVAGIHTGCTYLLVKKEAPYQTIGDLKGKKIGVAGLADAGTIITKRALAKAGVNVSDKDLEVQFTVFGRNDLPLVLDQGQVDAIAVGDPVASIAMEKYGYRALIDTAKTAPFDQEYCCVAMVTSKLAKANPKAAEKATRAILKGASWVQAHLEEAAKLELDKKYVAGNLALNTSLLKKYHFIPSVKGGYEAVKANAEELAAIGLLKEGTDGKKFADDAFLFFKDMPDSL